jgi:hypothetical protein
VVDRRLILKSISRLTQTASYSHQAPGLIDTLLTLPHNMVRVYLPPDGNSAISTIDHCLRSKGYVNLIVSSKQPGSNYLSAEVGRIQCGRFSAEKTDNSYDGHCPVSNRMRPYIAKPERPSGSSSRPTVAKSLTLSSSASVSR